MGKGVLEPRDLPAPFPGPDPASAAHGDSGLATVTSRPRRRDPCLAPRPKPPVGTRSGSTGAQPCFSVAGLAPRDRIRPQAILGWRRRGGDTTHSPVCPGATCVPGTGCAVRKELLCRRFLRLPCPGVSHLLRPLLPVPDAPRLTWGGCSQVPQGGGVPWGGGGVLPLSSSLAQPLSICDWPVAGWMRRETEARCWHGTCREPAGLLPMPQPFFRTAPTPRPRLMMGG